MKVQSIIRSFIHLREAVFSQTLGEIYIRVLANEHRRLM